jgi:hypothetical protein
MRYQQISTHWCWYHRWGVDNELSHHVRGVSPATDGLMLRKSFNWVSHGAENSQYRSVDTMREPQTLYPLLWLLESSSTHHANWFQWLL